MIRVLLADDQALVRTGFRMILKAEPDIDVVGEAADGAQAVDATRRLRPDVVVMDVRMPHLDGLEATRRILAASNLRTRVLMLTTFDLDEYVYDALRAGASGFLLKDGPADQLVAAIRTVADGGALLAPTVTRRLIEEFARQRSETAPAPAALAELTARERSVLATARTRALERRGRDRARSRRSNDQDPRRARAVQARPARPHTSGRLRVRVRPRAPANP